MRTPDGGDATRAAVTRAPNGYHGQPVLKEPVWSWEIPLYLFTGGLAGAAAGTAFLAGVRGEEVLARRAWLTASAGIAVSPPLLIADLGRPARFLNMLRMFKITSPMSVGSWILSVSGASTAAATASVFTDKLGWAGQLARPVAAISGLGLATYTAALVTNTSVPAWHEARSTLPFVFAGGAAVSAGGACVAATPLEHAAGARRLALGAAGAELVATELMRRRLGMHGEVYAHGRAAWYARASKGCLAAGAGLLAARGTRNRSAAVAAGTLLCAGALATRLSVFAAGKLSAADPRYVIEPQRRRLG